MGLLSQYTLRLDVCSVVGYAYICLLGYSRWLSACWAVGYYNKFVQRHLPRTVYWNENSFIALERLTQWCPALGQGDMYDLMVVYAYTTHTHTSVVRRPSTRPRLIVWRAACIIVVWVACAWINFYVRQLGAIHDDLNKFKWTFMIESDVDLSFGLTSTRLHFTIHPLAEYRATNDDEFVVKSHYASTPIFAIAVALTAVWETYAAAIYFIIIAIIHFHSSPFGDTGSAQCSVQFKLNILNSQPWLISSASCIVPVMAFCALKISHWCGRRHIFYPVTTAQSLPPVINSRINGRTWMLGRLWLCPPFFICNTQNAIDFCRCLFKMTMATWTSHQQQ